ncbi:unnamed protein product [Onchocerca flexuosa]|uniref:Leucine Rich repeat-containing domain protein n=1 Tax=Onchocerca flexuosa TaxID=387005 RepID=A0A183I5Q6_9BILA|nr:unnamed protein product [Onchocerca flexuosa]
MSKIGILFFLPHISSIISFSFLIFATKSKCPCDLLLHHINYRCLLLDDNHTDLQLNDIIEGCSSLEVLSLKRCSKLRDEDFRAISKCTTLKELHLTGITNMTDGVLTSVAFGIPLLEILDISYCKSLTSNGLECLAMLEKLDHVCVNGIYDFDDRLVNMIHKCRPYCIIEAYHCRYTMTTDEQFQMQVIFFLFFHLFQQNESISIQED